MAFCTSHWAALPRELRDGIYAAQRKPDKYPNATAAARAWLISNRFTKQGASKLDIDTDAFVDKVAALAHETNRAYCRAIGDTSQLPWEDAPIWQRRSATRGVRFAISHPDTTPAALHESWWAEKRAEGWVYGESKNPVTKTHPCCVPYDQLPAEQRVKDHLFQAVVRTTIAQFR